MKSLSKLALVALLAMFLFGCGTTGEVEEETVSTDQSTTSGSTTDSGVSSSPFDSSDTSSSALTQEELDRMSENNGEDGAMTLDDPNSLLAKRVVYFDFDRSDVRDEFRDVLQAHAEYLGSHSSASLTVEGHGDERGSREYNIALGERRANSVQRMLTAQGARPDQVSVISYGEERPASMGHDEAAWSLNRRAELIYTSR